MVAGVALAASVVGETTTAFDAGMRALVDGDYAVAYCNWIPLARQGDADAQYHLGWLYANGNGLAVDIEKALDWWLRAARQGHTDAQFAVALAYMTGEGIGRDLDRAVDWYLSAARLGHADAREILLRLNGDPSTHLLDRHPEVIGEAWFGWPALVSGERVNARAGPATDQAIVAQLSQDSRVRVIGVRDDWYMVVLDGIAGSPPRTAWMYQALLRVQRK